MGIGKRCIAQSKIGLCLFQRSLEVELKYTNRCRGEGEELDIAVCLALNTEP